MASSVKALSISQPAVVVFSASVSSDELRAILTSAAPPPPSCAGVRPLVELAPHLHLTLDALHTLPELGFAEVVTTDACLADAFEFDNAAVINVAARTKVVLVRSASGGTWQRAGVEACGPDEALLPPLLTDADVLDALTCPLLPASDLPLTWQWASHVVLGDAAMAPSAAAPSAAAFPAQASQQEAHAAVADGSRAMTPALGRVSAEAASAAWPEEQQEEGEVAWALPARPRSFAFTYEAAPSASPSSSSSSSSSASASPASGIHAALRAASFTASPDGRHLRLSAERRQACMARLAQCLALEAGDDEVPRSTSMSAAVGGAAPFLPQVASAAVASH